MSVPREYVDPEDQAAYDKGYRRQRLRDALAIGAGAGLGGAAGWGVGEVLRRHVMKSPKLTTVVTMALPALAAGVSGYAAHLSQERDDAKLSNAHRSGLAAVLHRQNALRAAKDLATAEEARRNRTSVNNILHAGEPEKIATLLSPSTWSHQDKKTAIGAGGGALAGLAVGGLISSKPTMLRFGLPGAVIGGYLGRRRAKQEMGMA